MVISPSNAQHLSSHQWKDRLVIIQSENATNPLFKKQIEEFKKDPEGLEERKIAVYLSVAGNYKMGLEEREDWKKAGKDLEKLKNSTSEFEVILMGLDGGVKLRKNELLTRESLFRTIDQMPMRMSEIRRKKKDNQL